MSLIRVPINHHNMIQRTLLRQSQVLATNVSRSFRPSPSHLYSPPLRIPLVSTSRALASRCYSTEQTPESDIDGEASSAETNQPGEQEAEDPHKKEVEAKDREITDLKVRAPLFIQLLPFQLHPSYSAIHTGQIPSLRRRVPQPPRPHQARDTVRSRFCHLPLRQRLD